MTEDGSGMGHKVVWKRQNAIYIQKNRILESVWCQNNGKHGLVQFSLFSPKTVCPQSKLRDSERDNGVLLQWTSWKLQQPTSYHNHLRSSLTTNSYLENLQLLIPNRIECWMSKWQRCKHTFLPGVIMKSDPNGSFMKWFILNTLQWCLWNT